MDDRKPFGYLYRTTIFTGRKILVYVGKREKPRFTKSYLGSGAIIRKILADGDYETVNVELVEYFYTREELHAREISLIDQTREEWLGNCLNIARGGVGGNPALWTLERCKESALRFKTRTAWARGASGAYSRAQLKGWLDECCAHMELKQLPNGYWNLARCKADALRFKSRREWWLAKGGSYQAAKLNGWIDVCCTHMAVKKRPNGYWTFERCMKDASKYRRRLDWSTASGAAVAAAQRAGWMKECCAHMARSRWDNFDRDNKQAA